MPRKGEYRAVSMTQRQWSLILDCLEHGERVAYHLAHHNTMRDIVAIREKIEHTTGWKSTRYQKESLRPVRPETPQGEE